MSTSVQTIRVEDPREDFGSDVRRDLHLSPKQLQSKYLYDALGSALFEAICQLPWYGITRAEHRLLQRFGNEMVRLLHPPITIAELGSGNGEKMVLLLEAIKRRQERFQVHLIDISSTALAQSTQTIAQFKNASVCGYRATYEAGLRLAASKRTPLGTFLVLFLGSNIGNFDRPAAREFLSAIRSVLRRGDALLLGADLLKSEKELLLAYDDPLGVTAAFNKNLLARANFELGANFKLDQFDHRAVFNAEESRVEMHLVSRGRQTVEIPGASCTVHFEEGEYIWTESSYKYEPAALFALVAEAGFRCAEQWIEPEAQFSSNLLIAE